MDQDIHTMTIDSKEQALLRVEASISRLRAIQAKLIADLDRQQVATGDGCRSMSEWIASRLDMAAENASTLVTTARRLEALPMLADELAAGAVSFDRVTELAKTSTVETEATDLESSLRLDINGLRRETALRRRISRRQERHAFAGRYVMLQPNLDKTSYRLNGELPGTAGQTLETALHARGDQLAGEAYDPPLTRTQLNADALTSMALDTLTGTGDGPDNATIVATISVDATLAAVTDGEAGATVVAGPRVGPETLEEILCQGVAEVTVDAADGRPLGVGKTVRTVPPRLPRHVLARDQGCTIDGCTSRYRLQTHHIIHASVGGPTEADNLTTVCWFHHHIAIHGHGYRIDPNSPTQRRRFVRPYDGHDPPYRPRRRPQPTSEMQTNPAPAGPAALR